MKHIITTTLLLLVLLLPTHALAHDFEVDGIYYNINGTTATVTSSPTGNKYSCSVTIPATVTYNGTTYSVTTIGYSAFSDCSGLTDINIPNSVTNIGNYAFYNCTSLTNIDIPNSVTSIDEGAFEGCSSLTNINIPNSVTNIESSAFYGTAWYNNQPDGLVYAGLVAYKYKGTMPEGTNITIKDGTRGIAGGAFSYCSGLTDINIPNSVTNIGNSAFSRCTSLATVNIPNSVTNIESSAFYGTAWYNNQPDGLVYAGLVAYKYKGTMPEGTNITIKDGTKGVADDAFYNCSNLTAINIPNSVTAIGKGAFYGCTSLTNINIPNSVTTIDNNAFGYCSSLATISVASNNPTYDSRNNCNAIIETATNTLIAGCRNTAIPNSVTAIGNYAFSDCSSLTNIDIPNSVTNIGARAFSGCSSLTTINITNSVTNISSSVFSGCSSLININIPNSVTNIGDGAFSWCSSLTDINIPNSVTNIGNSAFYSCSSLTDINIPNSVTNISSSVFRGCSSLTTVNIPNSVTNIGAWAFSGCSSLININIPNSVTNIGAWAFSGCSSLININIPNSVTTISNNTFENCSNLTTINIPNSVTTIGSFAFYRCSSLTSINIPNSVTSIGSSAFSSTAWYNNQPDGLVYAGLVAYKYKGTMPQGTSITLKEGTKGIADNAFYGCSSLTNINIPNSVTAIGYYAFYGCTSLTNINIPNSVTIISEFAFQDCTNLTSVNIGNSVTTIDYWAFYGCNSLNNLYCYAAIPPECIFLSEYDYEVVFSHYSATLHVPATSLAAYFTAPEWSNFENIVGDAVAPIGIAISRDSVEIRPGEQIELTAIVTPANASYKEVTWYSTDTSIATVEDGVVTAVSYGECDIFAYCMGIPAICHITVANRISLGQQEAMLLPNHMLTLTPSAPTMPSGFTATSSDPTVAAVRVMSGKVQVVGIKEGTTTITVASTDGTAQPATCLVTVYTEPCDVNCDGFITIGDATQMIDYLLGGAVDNFKVANADVNGDGQISIGDVTILIDQLLSSNN